MSKAVAVAGQLALDFTPPPAPPPVVVRPQPPKRPCALALAAQRARTERVLRATEAKIRAVPKAKRRTWETDAWDDRTRLDRMLADVPDLAIIGRWTERPTSEQEWDAMRAHDIPHGACMYRRCHRTGHFVLIADWHAVGHFEERLDA